MNEHSSMYSPDSKLSIRKLPSISETDPLTKVFSEIPEIILLCFFQGYIGHWDSFFRILINYNSFNGCVLRKR